MQNLFTIAAALGSDSDNDGAGGHAANPEHSSASGRDMTIGNSANMNGERSLHS